MHEATRATFHPPPLPLLRTRVGFERDFVRFSIRGRLIRLLFMQRSLVPVISPFPSLQISVDICQELHRFSVSDAASQSDSRFAYFRDRILPQCTSGTLIFIADYFDYVRVRNHLKRERASFVQLHEYAKNEKVSEGLWQWHPCIV